MTPGAQQSSRGAAVLRVRGLSVTYGPLTALQGVDLDVFAGEVVGVAGDNGAGKSTLLRCICGDVPEAEGEVWLDGQRLSAPSAPLTDGRIGVAWQHLVLSDNLDVAANLLLGKERGRLLMSTTKVHARARTVLADLGITIPDTTRLAWTLTAAERQLLAIARAVTPRPRLLLLDEPTAVLSRSDSVQVERLISRIRDEGTTIVLISHDIDQLFRLAGRVLVLRRGQAVAEVELARSHPDELVALIAGHDASAVPRRQLNRLHGLTEHLSYADPAAGLRLILSTLGAALGTPRLSVHLVDGGLLKAVAAVGVPPAVHDAWREIPLAVDNDPISRAVSSGAVAVSDYPPTDDSVRASLMRDAGIATSWAVPFSGGGGLVGVISVFRARTGPPARDELDLVNLYAGYVVAALERDRLLVQATARNKVLETIRAVLQTLAGPDALADRLETALQTLREAVHADALGLYGPSETPDLARRAYAGDPTASAGLARQARQQLDAGGPLGQAQLRNRQTASCQLVINLSPTTALAAQWNSRSVATDERVLLEDAAHSILLALERERTELARREAAALRRSQELQRQFLARLSHELRTPLTAIGGSASSLMQTDVSWDETAQRGFLRRISTESARLRRLVDDLLDFSMIESGVLRIRPDWVDLALVIDAARACLSTAAAAAITIDCPANVPVIWADHDRLEQVMMNLMDNAVRHNPAGTAVAVRVRTDGPDHVTVEVADDGIGIPSGVGGAHPTRRTRPSPTAGAGLGLSIARGIIDAHHGTWRRHAGNPGTRFVIRLPVEGNAPAMEPSDA